MRCSKAHSLFAADRLSVQLSQVTELSQVETSKTFHELYCSQGKGLLTVESVYTCALTLKKVMTLCKTGLYTW